VVARRSVCGDRRRGRETAISGHTKLRNRSAHIPEQKQALVEACEASGLSFPRIAALHEVNYQTLVFQVKKSRQGDPRMESSTFSDKSHGAFY
jgi:transposase-like protein